MLDIDLQLRQIMPRTIEAEHHIIITMLIRILGLLQGHYRTSLQHSELFKDASFGHVSSSVPHSEIMGLHLYCLQDDNSLTSRYINPLKGAIV